MRFNNLNLLTMILIISFCSSNVLANNSSNEAKNSQAKSLSIYSLTLEMLMSDPDWMGNSPENPKWSLDGQSIYFQQKAQDHKHRNKLQIDINSLKQHQLTKTEMLVNASANAKLNIDKTKGVFNYQDDIYLIDLNTNNIQALTSDARKQKNPHFVGANTISYQVDYEIYLYHLKTHLEQQIANFKLMEDPDKKNKKSYLEQSQPRLLAHIKNKQQEKSFQKQRKTSNKQHAFKSWYLGKDVEIKTFRISPNTQWVIVGTLKKDLIGTNDRMPEFVTENGYVKNRKVRSLVGTNKPMNETFYLFDLVNGKKKRLDLSNLPGINDDPLKKLRKSAAKKIGYKYNAQKGMRAVYAYHWAENQGVEWTDNSEKAALLLFSYDNKSRWIVTLSVDNTKLRTAHWMSDDAWINDSAFNQFAWLPDNKTLYYLSEESGYSHLYIKNGTRKSAQLTYGDFEVSNLTASADGKNIYFKANQKHPGIYEIYSVNLDTRNSQPITDFGGMNDYVLSPNNLQLLITHSSTTTKPELYVKDINTASKPIKLTSTASNQFNGYQWQAPKIVEVKSSVVEKPIYSRLYTPENITPEKKKPAVMFVHGAGYLQNSHQGWSGYYREFMFHNYLTAKGYVVLDMDYRASKGYGRDWRTAIYRNMGTPELQDLKDGAKWLVDNMNVDKKRIGVYGGSYGGFMTFMALFKAPDLFASGAALRPVTDWSHYNHGYTSNILNTPQIDPDAFERSSPIEFAAGLNKPLLICHGMVDDNVFFKDTVRLVQKLIELKKTKYFETAIYPVEAHGFKEPTSWLDEYTRIEQLFDRTLRLN